MIRRAMAQDADAVLHLARDFAASFSVEETAFRASFNELLNDADVFFAVAQNQERVVGYVLAFCHHTLYANGRVAWVEELMVQTESRKQGVGRALIQSAEAWATERECRLIALATRRSAPFYRVLGYQESATYFRKLLE